MGFGANKRQVSHREFTRVLRHLGFEVNKKQGKGAHEKWVHPEFRGAKRVVLVSEHNQPFAKGILRAMIDQTGLKPQEFYRCLDDPKRAMEILER
ncbi:type II toxin-antitoxin system HicA family toxin [Thioalkalivibrio halophilus]|uniref:Addiction module toxin, HicA family n=1 Tax=Thioalkalivibrio halophilus TaxID=252474 RepID=A0A1V2ZY83_9GAMM|nr:type II toxin-antitoxin system HicA family toxin [Thioalkalivibrio halophilus]OOC10036.1 hypothetical protein B1A74_07865 [Thioalkalivibrio halophilus]